MQSVLSLSDQLDMFKDYLIKLEQLVGNERTSKILSQSLIILVTGSNDITNTYFGTPLRKCTYDVSSYSDFLVGYASTFVQVKNPIPTSTLYSSTYISQLHYSHIELLFVGSLRIRCSKDRCFRFTATRMPPFATNIKGRGRKELYRRVQ